VLATGDLEIKLDLTVFVKFHSRVSLSSYRMKFVWPESIQGLGQHAGKLNLKIELYFCRLGLKYMKSLSEQAGQKAFLFPPPPEAGILRMRVFSL
jgi:hypothetical protein